jgi:hypothetical protein
MGQLVCPLLIRIGPIGFKDLTSWRVNCVQNGGDIVIGIVSISQIEDRPVMMEDILYWLSYP